MATQLIFCIGVNSGDYYGTFQTKNEKRNGRETEIRSVFQPTKKGWEIEASPDFRSVAEISANHRPETDEAKEKKTSSQSRIQDCKNQSRRKAIKKVWTYRG